jgi:putative SOS response-associated peptidase YedK
VCGRLGIYLLPHLVAQLFRAGYTPDPLVQPTWNFAPGQDTGAVLRDPETGGRRLELLRWGFLPRWAKDPARTRRPINARSDTVTTSRLFKDAFAKRRCLVPAANFYEWKSVPGQKHKAPYAIARADGRPLALGGVWDSWRQDGGNGAVPTFAIVTTSANREMASVHHRMPLVLEESDWPLWLGEAEGDPAALLHPTNDGVLRIWPVSRKVNSPANNTADLLAPATAPEQRTLILS